MIRHRPLDRGCRTALAYLMICVPRGGSSAAAGRMSKRANVLARVPRLVAGDTGGETTSGTSGRVFVTLASDSSPRHPGFWSPIP
jgi:hypothetical protein